MKVYVFMEPHYTGGDATVEITEEKIRAYMNKNHPIVLEKHQIEEFCAHYFAWKKDGEE